MAGKLGGISSTGTGAGHVLDRLEYADRYDDCTLCTHDHDPGDSWVGGLGRETVYRYGLGRCHRYRKPCDGTGFSSGFSVQGQRHVHRRCYANAGSDADTDTDAATGDTYAYTNPGAERNTDTWGLSVKPEL